MLRILLTIVALAAHGAGAATTPVSVAVEDSAVILQGDGELAKFRYFALTSPPRLVVDLYATSAADLRNNIPLSNGFARLRIGAYPDKTRFVFDAGRDGLPSYTVEQAGRRVFVNWKAPVQSAGKIAPTRPLSPDKAAQTRAFVTSVEIGADQPTGSASGSLSNGERHQVRIALQPFAGLRKLDHFTARAPGRLVVDLHGVRPGAHTRRFALGGGFRQLRIRDTGDKTRLVFELDGDRWPGFEVTEDPERAGVVVSWRAPAGVAARTPARPAPPPASPDAGMQAVVPALPAGLVADAPPADVDAGGTQSARTDSTVRTTLVADDAEIRDVLAQLADVSGRRIVIDESVSGRVMLRLVNIPWDQALDMVVGIAGLRVIEDGDVIRVTGAPTSGVRRPPTPRELIGSASDGAR